MECSYQVKKSHYTYNIVMGDITLISCAVLILLISHFIYIPIKNIDEGQNRCRSLIKFRNVVNINDSTRDEINLSN